MVDAALQSSRPSEPVKVKETLRVEELLTGILLPITKRLAQSTSLSIDPDTQIEARYLNDEYRGSLAIDQKFTISTAERSDRFEHFPPTPSGVKRFNLRDILELLVSLKPILERESRSQTGPEWAELRQVLTSKRELREYEATRDEVATLSRELTTIAQKLAAGPERERYVELGKFPSWMSAALEETRTEEEVVKGWDSAVRDVVESATESLRQLRQNPQLTIEQFRVINKNENLSVGLAWEFLNEWLNEIYDRNYILRPPERPTHDFSTQPEPAALHPEDAELLDFIGDKMGRWVKNLRDSIRLAEEIERRHRATSGSGAGSVSSDTTTSETPAETATPKAIQSTEPSAEETAQPQAKARTPQPVVGPQATGNFEPPQNTRQLYDFYRSNGASYAQELAKYRNAVLPLFLEANGLNLAQAQLSLDTIRQQYPVEYQDLQYWFSSAIEDQLVKILREDPSSISTPEKRLSTLLKLQRSMLTVSLPQLQENINRLALAIPAARSIAFAQNLSQVDQYLADHPVTDSSDALLSSAAHLEPADLGEFGQYLSQIGLSTSDQEAFIKKLSVYLAAGESPQRFLVLDQVQLERILGIQLPANMSAEALNEFQFSVSHFAGEFSRQKAVGLGAKIGKNFSFTALYRPSRTSAAKLDQKFSEKEIEHLSILAELTASMPADSILAASVATEAELNRMGIVYDLQMKALREAMVQEQLEQIIAAYDQSHQKFSAEQREIVADQINANKDRVLAKGSPRGLVDGFLQDANGNPVPSGSNLQAAQRGLSYVKNGLNAVVNVNDALVTAALSGVGYGLIPQPIRKYLSAGITGLILTALAKMLTSLNSLLGGLAGGVGGAIGGAGIGALVGGVPGAVVGGILGGVGGLVGGAYVGIPGGLSIQGPGISAGGGLNQFNLGARFGGGSGSPPPPPGPIQFAGFPVSAGTALTTLSVSALVVTAVINQSAAFLPPLIGVSDNGELSQFVTVVKSVNPNPPNGKFENAQLPQTVSYSITIAPKDQYHVEITSLQDVFTFMPNEKVRAGKPNPPLPTSPYATLDKVLPVIPDDKKENGKIVLEPGESVSYGGQGKYDATFSSDFNDSAVQNTVTMKILVVDKSTGTSQQVAGTVPVEHEPSAPTSKDPAKPTENSVTASAVICFGDCPLAGRSKLWPVSGTLTQLPYNGGLGGGSHSKGGPFGAAGLDAYDIGGKEGDTVYAPFNGRLCGRPFMDGGYGNYLVLDQINGATFQLIFAHLQNTIYNNQQTCADIKEGQPIGKRGTTGNSTGPHLHYGLAPAQGAESRIEKIVPIKSGGGNYARGDTVVGYSGSVQ